MEGPELRQVAGQRRPEERGRGQDSVSAQPGLPGRSGRVGLRLLADGGGLHGRRLRVHDRGGGGGGGWIRTTGGPEQ